MGQAQAAAFEESIEPRQHTPYFRGTDGLSMDLQELDQAQVCSSLDEVSEADQKSDLFARVLGFQARSTLNYYIFLPASTLQQRVSPY